MPAQLIFDLPSKPALGSDDFFVSPANQLAVATVENWRNWAARKLLLIGPHGSGKTHLVHVWAEQSGALVLQSRDLPDGDAADLLQINSRIAVEDVDRIAKDDAAQRALFHLHNLVLAEGGYLMMSASALPGVWTPTLPDLASRILGTQTAHLQPADDVLLAAVLMKMFSDRQLIVKPQVISYLVSRMERSFEAAQNLVQDLDTAALAEKRAVTKALATRILEQQKNL